MISFSEYASIYASDYLLNEDMDFNHPVFIRYGGLSSVPQSGYCANGPQCGHQPPANRGIYAFVKGFVEPFLLGGGNFAQGKKDMIDSRRQEWVRDRAGNVITDKSGSPEWEKYMNGDSKLFSYPMKDGSTGLVRQKSPKEFRYSGEIWSHLGEHMRPEEVIARHGSWVKSDMRSYIRALKREVGVMKAQKKRQGIGFTKDHLEVFIEKV